MPIVTVQLTREGTEPGVNHVTAEQKAAIYKGMSEVLLDVLGKPLEWTWVVFEEVEMENWGLGRDARRRIPQVAGREGRLSPHRVSRKAYWGFGRDGFVSDVGSHDV